MYKFELMEYGITIGTVTKLRNVKYEDLEKMLINLPKGLSWTMFSRVIELYQEFQLQDDQLSVYDLFDFGFNKVQLDRIYSKDLSVYNLCNEENIKNSDLPLQTKEKLLKEMPRYVQKCNDLFGESRLSFIYDNSDKLYGYIKKSFLQNERFTIPKLKMKIEKIDSSYPLEDLMHDIDKLFDKGKLKKDFDGLYYTIPTLREKIESLDDREKDIILKKFSGGKLETIAIEYGLSKERVRQIILKKISSLGTFSEDKYKSVFEKYAWTYETFNAAFGVSRIVYGYLDMKYRNSNAKKLIEIFDDDNFELQLFKIDYEALKECMGFVSIYGEMVKKNKDNVLECFVKHECKDSRQFDWIFENINLIYKKYDLTDRLDEKTFKNTLDAKDYLIMGKHAKYRYYNKFNLTPDEISRLKGALNVNSGEYSTYYFFSHNKELMEEIDIRDEYELHSLLKDTNFSNEENPIIYSRIPHLYIGYSKKIDKEEFYIDTLKEIVPISINEAAEYFFNNFGQNYETVKAYISSTFSKYINHDGMINMDFEILDDVILNKIKEKFNKEFLSLNEAKSYFELYLGKKYMDYFNNYNLNKLGYKIKSDYLTTVNCNSIEDFYKNYIADKKTFKKRDFGISSLSLNTFLYNKECDFEIFKLDKSENPTYLTRQFLEKRNICADDLILYVRNIIKKYDANKYFTYYMAKDNYYDENVENYGFSDEFFENIISRLPEINTIRLSGNYIFYKILNKDDQKKIAGDFLKDLLISFESIYVEDLINYLKINYGMSVDEEKLIYKAQEGGCFFDRVLYKLYNDKENYLYELVGGKNND